MEFTDGHDPANCQLPAAPQVSTKGQVAHDNSLTCNLSSFDETRHGNYFQTFTILETKRM